MRADWSRSESGTVEDEMVAGLRGQYSVFTEASHRGTYENGRLQCPAALRTCTAKASSGLLWTVPRAVVMIVPAYVINTRTVSMSLLTSMATISSSHTQGNMVSWRASSEKWWWKRHQNTRKRRVYIYILAKTESTALAASVWDHQSTQGQKSERKMFLEDGSIF